MPQNKFLLLFSKYRIWIYCILIPLIVGLVIFQLIDSYISPLPYISLSQVHLSVLILAELLLMCISLDIYDHSQAEKRHKTAWQLSFAFFLLNLIALYLFADFYDSRSNYPLVASLLSLVPALELLFSLGILASFWKGFGGYLINFWNDFSFSEKEAAGERHRWMTIIVLAACFIVGLGLRLYNLSGFPPYVDEYIHIRAAASLIAGGPLTWDRAYLTVTLPVYLSYRIFGMNLWASRFPMTLINMMAIFPLYFLGKRINKWVGYISVFLFAVSPWIIAVSSTVRDYAIIPVFFYLAAFLLIDLLDWEGLSFKQYLFRNKYRIIIVILILAYALFDKTSILKIIVVAYGIFVALALLKMLKNNPLRWLKITVIGSGVICFLVVLVYSKLPLRFFKSGLLTYQTDLTSWNSLVSNSFRQWYPLGALSYVIILLGGFFAIRAIFIRYRKSDFVIVLCYLAFAATLVYLIYFLVSPYVPTRTRYGILMEYWYLVVAAAILYVIFYAFRCFFSKRFLAIPIVIVLALFINFQAIYTMFTYQGGGVFQLNGERHYILEPAYDYLVEQMTTKDILVSDVMTGYDLISGQQLGAVKTISFHSIDPLTVIKEYPQGWFAVTSAFHPENTDLQFSNFDYAGKHVHYYGLVGEVYMWQWGSANPIEK